MLKIYNTLSRQKETFQPLHEGKVNMYVCGMTVYDYCHLGHARVLVAFDLIVNYMRSQGYDVTYVRNITDIDDKILNRAAENGEPFEKLTDRFITAMHEDEAKLGVTSPSMEPRATEHLPEIIAMVENLVENGYAYAADNGDVYFAVTKFADYGKLSKKNLDELLSGARVEVADSKKDARDFALWKAAKEGEASWDSPWGPGRPGWHIECSAMSTGCLGSTFDIHGGGPDLPFPHHENEIAQSEAATGQKYVNYWMHAGAVRVDDEKMSKSLGNFFTIREILEKYHPEVVRYFLVSSHYRSSINYSEDHLLEAKAGLERFYTALRAYGDVVPLDLQALEGSENYRRFVTVMDDDFNTREAIAVMFDLARELNTQSKVDAEAAKQLAAELKGLGALFGLLQAEPESFLQAGADDAISAEQIETLIADRTQAKKDKNYARADEIRQELLAQGVVLEDSREGTKWRRE